MRERGGAQRTSISDESPAHRIVSPESLGEATTGMLLVVEDPESVVERVTAR